MIFKPHAQELQARRLYLQQRQSNGPWNDMWSILYASQSHLLGVDEHVRLGGMHPKRGIETSKQFVDDIT